LSVVSGLSGAAGAGAKYLNVDVGAGQTAYVRVATTFDYTIEQVPPATGQSEASALAVVPSGCAALAAAGPSTAPAAAPAAASQEDDALTRGSAAEERGDLAGALAIYTETLRKYVTRMGSIPDVVDRAIDVSLRMRPPPAIPDSASKHANDAVAAINNAKSKADFAVARRAYADALADAPWWPDAWYNLAKLDGAIGNADDERQDLTWYLRAAPDAPDAAQVRQQIGTLGGTASH
jgi:tetratricopeptide (TPR) repeat protein